MSGGNKAKVYISGDASHLQKVISNVKKEIEGLRKSGKVSDIKIGNIDTKGMSSAASSAGSINMSIGRAALGFASMVGAAYVFVDLMNKAAYAMTKLYKDGLNFKMETDSIKIGLSGMYSMFQSIKDSGGNELNGFDRLRASIALANEDMRKMQILGIQTGATFEEIAKTYQSAIGMGSSLGIQRKELIELSSLFANFSKSIGQQEGMAAQELRAVLSNDIDRNSPIPIIMGWNKGGVNREAYLAALKEGGETFSKYILDSTANMRMAMDLQGQSLSGLFDQAKDIYSQFALTTVQSLSDKLLTNIKPIFDKLFTVDGWDKSIIPLQEALNYLGGEVGERIISLFNNLLNYAIEFGNRWKEGDQTINNMLQTFDMMASVVMSIGSIVGVVFDAMGTGIEKVTKIINDISASSFGLVNNIKLSNVELTNFGNKASEINEKELMVANRREILQSAINALEEQNIAIREKNVTLTQDDLKILNENNAKIADKKLLLENINSEVDATIAKIKEESKLNQSNLEKGKNQLAIAGLLKDEYSIIKLTKEEEVKLTAKINEGMTDMESLALAVKNAFELIKGVLKVMVSVIMVAINLLSTFANNIIRVYDLFQQGPKALGSGFLDALKSNFQDVGKVSVNAFEDVSKDFNEMNKKIEENSTEAYKKSLNTAVNQANAKSTMQRKIDKNPVVNDTNKNLKDVTATAIKNQAAEEPKKTKLKSGGSGKSAEDLAYENARMNETLELNALKRFNDNIRNILNNKNAIYDIYYKNNLMSIQDYYNRKSEVLKEENSAEIEAIDKELAILKNSAFKDENERLNNESKYQDLLLKRVNLLRDIQTKEIAFDLERINALKDYERLVDGIKARVLEAYGKTIEARELNKKIERSQEYEKFRNDPNASSYLKDLYEIQDINDSFNDTLQQMNEIKEQTAEYVNSILKEEELGLIGAFKANNLITEQYALQNKLLDEKASKLEKIAEESGSEELVKKAEKERMILEKSYKNYDTMQKELSKAFNEGLTTAFSDMLLGTKSAKEAMNDFFGNLHKQLLNKALSEAIAMLTNKLFGEDGFGGLAAKAFGASPTSNSNDGGGFLGKLFDSLGSSISGLFGGGGTKRASGGPVEAGKMYMTGETGRELFMPSQSGYVLSASQTRQVLSNNSSNNNGNGVIVNFTVNAKDAESFKNSENQIAARITSILSKANKVN